MINKLGFGFLRLPQIEEDLNWEKIDKMVDVYIENGGNFFDTCYVYLDGKSEEAIRRCLVERKPRESFQLSNKIPGYKCTCHEDCQKFFDEQLERCGVEYFDILMLHWLNRRNYEKAEMFDEFKFLREKKAEGKAKRIGFSFHDSAEVLDEILTAHPEVDLVLLQINYLDWEAAGIESKKCYETAVRHGKKVLVMEPVKGGTLAQIPQEAEELLKEIHPDWTPSDWALRFVQSLPDVEICLSGMSDVDQVEANVKPFEPLNEKEIEALGKVRDIIEGQTAVSCTGCRYCVDHCPSKIQIPDLFKMYNEISRYPAEDWKIKPVYRQFTKDGGAASACVKCGSCEAHCPQHLKISEHMQEVADKFEKRKKA